MQRIKPWRSAVISFRCDWMETAINGCRNCFSLTNRLFISVWLRLHPEQNVMGLANKILSHKRRKLLCSFCWWTLHLTKWWARKETQHKTRQWYARVKSVSCLKLYDRCTDVQCSSEMAALCVSSHVTPQKSLAPLSRNKGFRTACKMPHQSKVSFKWGNIK